MLCSALIANRQALTPCPALEGDMEHENPIILTEADLRRADLQLAIHYLTSAAQRPELLPAAAVAHIATLCCSVWAAQAALPTPQASRRRPRKR
jgi:hypothetical protein